METTTDVRELRMNSRVNYGNAVILFAVILVASMSAYLTRRTFFSHIGPVVVDYWAFAAGVFLVAEGIWRIRNSAENAATVLIFRLLRISAGISIFTIHFLQFVRDGKLGG